MLNVMLVQGRQQDHIPGAVLNQEIVKWPTVDPKLTRTVCGRRSSDAVFYLRVAPALGGLDAVFNELTSESPAASV